jgi:hypothetical protein
VAGKEARQLIGRGQEIDGGNDQQDDTEQSENELHVVSSLNQSNFSTSFGGARKASEPKNPALVGSGIPGSR